MRRLLFPDLLFGSVLFLLLGSAGWSAAQQLRLDVAETDEHFSASREVSRTLIIENTGPESATATIVWRTIAKSLPIEEGRFDADIEAGGKVDKVVRLRMPSVVRKTELDFLAEVLHGERKGVTLHKRYQVYPANLSLSWRFLQGRRIRIFDPTGETIEVLREIGGRAERVSYLESLFSSDSDLAIVGSDAIDSNRLWRRFQDMLNGSSTSAPPRVDSVDLIFVGEGFSQFATRKGELVSYRARVELEAIDPKTGKILGIDRETFVAVDLSEQIAGKTALQEAAARLAFRMIPEAVQNWRTPAEKKEE